MDMFLTYRFKLFVMSLLLMTSIIFFHTPLGTFAASPEDFTVTIWIAASWLFVFWVCIFVPTLLFYFLVPSTVKTFGSVLLSWLGIICWFNTYIWPLNFGPLNSWVFPVHVSISTLYRIIELCILMAIFPFIKIIAIKFVRPLVAILFLLNIAFAGQTVCNVFNMASEHQIVSYKDKKQHFQKSDKLPENNKKVMAFSKEQNIIIWMFDGFQGDLIQDILEEYPDLAHKLTGFTWYPNTVSIGGCTVASIFSIAGGHNYSIDKINKRNSPLWKEWDEAYSVYPKSFGEKGYEVSFMRPSYLSNSQILTQWNVSHSETQYYVQYWKEEHGMAPYPTEAEEPPFVSSILLAELGIFKAAPHGLKHYIYRNSNWILPGKYDRKNADAKRKTISEWAFLDLLPQISNSNAPKRVLKFFQNDINHSPYTLDENCKVTNELKEGRNGAFNAAYCSLVALSKWFDWLKREGIYNNSKIILVADHGNMLTNRMLANDKLDTIGDHLTGMFHPLLMVKDFNEEGMLKKSDLFMTNADVPSIVCSAIGGCDGIMPDPIKNHIPSRKVITTDTFWSKDLKDKTSYPIRSQWMVTGNIFDQNNWKRIK